MPWMCKVEKASPDYKVLNLENEQLLIFITGVKYYSLHREKLSWWNQIVTEVNKWQSMLCLLIIWHDFVRQRYSL